MVGVPQQHARAHPAPCSPAQNKRSAFPERTIEQEMPPKEANPFGNPKPFLRAAAAGGAQDAAKVEAAGGDAAAAPQKSKKQMHRKDKVVLLIAFRRCVLAI